MIKLIVGNKGSGKTKMMIDMIRHRGGSDYHEDQRQH